MRTTANPRGKQAILVFALGWAMVFLAAPALGDPAPLFDNRAGVVAIDPGHGGQDKGARGPTGLLEKAVVLELARQLALELEADYRVTLTRSGDYSVEPLQRTAIANNARADLLVSLHAGAGFRHTIQGQAVYFHSGLSGNTATYDENRNTGVQRSWRRTQVRHAQASQELANVMKQQLEKISMGVPCRIQGASLVVLQGADMPAVLIELGHITHPDTEKALAAPRDLALLVKALSHGISQFMDQHTSLNKGR